MLNLNPLSIWLSTDERLLLAFVFHALKFEFIRC